MLVSRIDVMPRIIADSAIEGLFTGSPVSPQNDNVLFAQSRNVLLTPSRLGRWQKDNY